MVEPISLDLAQIRERGYLVVLAPYNSTTYFVYQGEPAGYEYELLGAFAKDLGVALKMVVVTDPKSLFPLLNSGEGDIAAARLIPPVGPTAALEDQSPVAFTRALYRTEPVLVQQDQPPSAAGEGTQKALAPGPADSVAGGGYSGATGDQAIAIGGAHCKSSGKICLSPNADRVVR